MPSKYPRIVIPKDPSLKEKIDSLSEYAMENGIKRDSVDSIAEAALKTLIEDSDLD